MGQVWYLIVSIPDFCTLLTLFCCFNMWDCVYVCVNGRVFCHFFLSLSRSDLCVRINLLFCYLHTCSCMYNVTLHIFVSFL